MKAHNQYYWQNKSGRTEQAKKHTREMEQKYSQKIKDCIAKTAIYDNRNIHIPSNYVQLGELTMEVMKTDTVDAIFKVKEKGRIAVLNFASYKNAGGGFLSGSRAQEECLCHESFLYNVLKEFKEYYYEQNLKDLNRALYRNKALYSPDIVIT